MNTQQSIRDDDGDCGDCDGVGDDGRGDGDAGLTMQHKKATTTTTKSEQ